MDSPVTESTRVYYQILDTSTASPIADYIEPATDYVQFIANRYLEEIDDPDNPGSTITNPLHTNFTGDERQIIEIPIVDDELHELDETIELRLVSATGTSVISTTQNTATATIDETDNIYVTIDSRSVSEGDSGNTVVPVTVRLSTLSTSDLTVNWEAKSVETTPTPRDTDDTATADTDYVAVSDGTLLIRAGNLTGTFDVEIMGDTDDTEFNETFTVRIESVTPTHNIALSSGREAKIWINEDDRVLPTLTIAGGSPVLEGRDQNATFTITSTAMPTGNELVVNYTPVSENFIRNSGRSVTPANALTFQDNGSGAYEATLDIALHDDSGVGGEQNEYLVVTLDEGTNYIVGDAAMAQVHVSDDDATVIPELTIAGPSGTVYEGFDAVFTITANQTPDRMIDVYYTLSESGGDFLTSDLENDTQISTLEFIGAVQIPGADPDPTATATISIPLEDDDVFDTPGSITVTLVEQAVGARKEYTLGSDPSVTVTVPVYDDNVPLFAIWPGPRVIEGGNTHAEFTVRTNLSPNAVVPIRFSFDRAYMPSSESTKTGTNADHPIMLDFRGDTRNDPILGTITVTPPKTEVSFRLPLNPADATIDPFTNGEFEVTLLPDDASFIRYAVRPTRNVATVSVIDGNSLPMLTIAPKANEVAEDTGSAVFTVTATGGNIDGKTLAIQYQPAEVGTGDFLQDSEKAGADPLSIDLTFTADGNGDFKQEITVQLDDDSEHEATGEIEVVLHGPASSTAINQSYVVGTQSSATITINDDDAPVLSIADGDPVTEGTDANAVFVVTADPSPNRVITVQYKVEQPGTGYDFVAVTDTTAQQFEWPTTQLDFTDDDPNCGVTDAEEICGKTTANLEVALIADNRDESHGDVRVTLVNPVEVMVTIGPDNSPNNVAVPHSYPPYKVSEISGEEDGDVMVMDDDDAPLLTIAAPTNPVIENAGVIPSVNFVITSSVDLGSGFTVRYDPSEVAGDFLNEGATPSQEDIATKAIDFVPSGSDFIAVLAVPIHNDNVAEDTGEIQVELLTGNSTTDSYVVTTGTEETEIAKRIQKATIYDDEVPAISIADAGTYTERSDSTINFLLTALVSPNKSITIKYTIAETGSGNFIDDALEVPDNEQQVDFSGGNKGAILTVPIVSDDVSEGDSTVTVTLDSPATLVGADWNVDTPNTPATATVNDFRLDGVTISSAYTSVAPNSSLAFTVVMDPKPDDAMTVPINAGVYVNDVMQSSLTLAGGSISSVTDGSDTTYFITIGGDGIGTGRVNTGNETTGNVVVNLLGTTGDLSVPIAEITRTANLALNATSTPVSEGTSARFTISANPTADKDITVVVNVSDETSTNFVEDGDRYIYIPAGTSSVTFSVALRHDSDADTDGIIQATLQDGTGYTYSSSDSPARIEVHDGDVMDPVILSIFRNATTIYEGEDAIFTVSRTGDNTSSLTFKYDIIDVGNVIDGESNERTGVILAGQSQLVLPAETTKTGVSLTGDSAVRLRLRSVLVDNTLDYRLAARSERRILVRARPEVVLSIEPNYILAGESFDLKATATETLIRPVKVRVDLFSSLSNNFLALYYPGIKILDIPVDETSATLSVRSRAAEVSGVDGIITARLLSVTGFTRPTSAPDHSVTVGVLESYPVVSLSAPARVSEDVANGMFEVTLDTGSFRPFTNLPIRVTGLNVSETGSNSGYLGSYDSNQVIEIGTSGSSTPVEIPVNNQGGYNGFGEITLTLADGDEYTANTVDNANTAQVIIEDTDNHPSRTISLAATDQVLEGEDITVTLTNNEALGASESIEVAFRVTANPEGFYNPTDSHSSPVIFTDTTPANEQTITIKTNDSDALTTNGTIDIEVVRGDQYEPDSATPEQVTIVAKETLPMVSISSSTSSIYEGDYAEFTVYVQNLVLTQPITVGLSVAQEAGENFIDEASTPTSVDVATTGTGKFRVKTIADATEEADGTITVTLARSPNQSYAVGSHGTASVTVQDNDDPALASINIAPVSDTAVTEADDAMAMFNITATGGTSSGTDPIDVVINISEEGNFLTDAAGDRAPIPVTPGATAGDVGTAVPLNEAIVNDTYFEVDGKIIAKIVSSSLYGVGANAVAEVAIMNDDTLPNISIAEVSSLTAEGSPASSTAPYPETDYNFAVSLSEATPNEVEVNFAVGKVGDTATINDDYSVVNAINTLTFPPNSTDPQMINIKVVGDELKEADEEFTITLSLPSGIPLAALPSDPTATGAIPNDDMTVPTVSIADAVGFEGSGTSNGSIEFTVTLSAAIGLPVTVNYATTDDTASSVSDADFIAVSDSLIIPASGNTSHNLTGTFAVTTTANDTAAANKTFDVTLTIPSDANATAGDTMATGTIIDDDAVAALTIADVTAPVSESAGSVDFVVSSTAARIVTVRYQAAGVTANDNFLTADQAAEKTKTLVFGSAGGSAPFVDTLRVEIDNDEIGEATGQIMVTLLAETGGPTTYSVPNNGDEVATATIWDNDAPELTITSAGDVYESEGSVRFAILARVSPNDMVMVNYDVVESTGAGVGDFIANSEEGSVANSDGKSKEFDFTGGKTLALLTIPVQADVSATAASTVTVTLTAEDPAGTNYTVATAITDPAVADNEAMATITPGDPPALGTPVVKITSDYEATGITEGYKFEFEVESDRSLVGRPPIDIEFTVTDNGTGATISGGTVQIAGGTTATGTVTTIGNIDTATDIVIAIRDGDDYDVDTDDPSITVAVKDNDTLSETNPGLTFSNVNYVADGDAMSLTVTASHIPSAETTVKVQLSGNVSFLDDGQSPEVDFVFAAGGTDMSKTVDINTKAGSASSNHGIVRATILEGNGYVRSNTVADNATSFVVVDDLPEISIDAITPVDEADGMFTVTLRSDFALVTGYPITITSLNVEDADTDAPTYDPQITTTSIQIPSASGNNTAEVTVTFTAVANMYSYDNLTVSLTEVDNDLYTVDTNIGMRTVTIRPTETSDRTVSIDAPASVVEGQSIALTLTADPALGTGESIMVELNVTNVTGTFFDLNPNNTMKYEINENSMVGSTANSVLATIPTRKQVSTTDGSIRVAVVRGEDYEPHSTNGSKTVTVQEDDLLPSITIARKDGGNTDIVEGEGTAAEFTVSAANPAGAGVTPPTQAIMVKVQISQVGNFLVDSSDRTVPVMSDASADLIVMIDDDEYDEDNGSITAVVLPDMPESGSSATYGVGADNTAMIGITDDDDEPLASIVSTFNATEGLTYGDDGLAVTLTPASGKTVKVSYTFADGTEAANGTDYMGMDDTLTFTPDSETGLTPTTMYVPFSIVSDEMDDPDESFTITLSIPADGNARVDDATKVSTVTIEESDTPVLSIASAADTTGVTEGLDFQFTITSEDPIPGTAGTDDLMLDIAVSDGGATTGAMIVETSKIIVAGERSATFTVSMNSNFDTDGSTPVNITVTLNDGADYNLSSTVAPIMVTVKDNDAPSAANPIITIARAADYIVEGGDATFTVTALESPEEAKTVNVVLSANNNDFIATSELTNLVKTATIPATGDPTATVSLTTKADDPDGADYGVITATLLDGVGYIRPDAVADRVASVVVLDNLPEISIAAIDPVDEADGEFTVTLQSDVTLATDRPITITALTVADTEGTDAPKYNPQITTDPILIPTGSSNNSGEVTVTFTAVADMYSYDDLRVSLAEVADDLYTVDTNANSRMVTIRPVETTNRTVAIDTPVSVVEGEMIMVNLTASEAPAAGEPIMVELNVTNATGNFLGSYNNSTKHMIADTTTDLTVPVPIPTSEQTSTTDGSISIAVVRGPNYEPHSTNGSKTVAVQEQDLLPKVTIALPSGAPTAYDEGEIVTFEISASAVSTEVELTVFVMLADDATPAHDFLADETTTNAHRVTVTTGSSNTLPIPTVADTVDEGTGGMITATIQPDPNQADRAERTTYLPGATADISEMASITDNDDDGTLPSVNIAADQTAVYEGDVASFTVSTDATLTEPVTVLVDVIETNSGTGDFIDGASDTFNLMLVIPQATGKFTREFITVADTTEEDEGTLTAMIKTDTESPARYSVGANHRASITLQDNDVDTLPSITISRKGSSTDAIVEGTDAVFEVSATLPAGATATAIMVDVQISQVGNFLVAPVTPATTSRVVPVMSGSTADLMVETDDDNYDDLDTGSIIAKVLSDMPDTSQGETATYSVGMANTAMIGVTDNDVNIPEASISATYSVSNAGDNDDDGLVVTLSTASGRTVQVAYAFADDTGTKGTDYDGTDGTLTFTPDPMTGLTPTTMFVPFEILLDAVAGTTKTFTITLSAVSDGNATVDDDAKEATVTIEFILPELTITAAELAVTDGAGVSAMFTITSQVEPRGGTIDIDYTPVSATFLAATAGTVDTIVSGTKVVDHTLTFTSERPYTATLPIPLNDITPGVDGDGDIMVTLNPKAPIEGYTVAAAPANSATVTVNDDDALPTISIAATYPDAIEGTTPIMLELSATWPTPPTNSTVSVNFTPTEMGGDFLGDQVQDPATPVTVQDVAISADVAFVDPDSDGTYTGNISITLQSDNIDEISAPIQITINPDPADEDKYKLGATTMGTVKILDDDAPELTITAGSPVTEGVDVKAVFTVTSVVNPGTDPILVDYTPVSANYLTTTASGDKVENYSLTFRGDGPYNATIEVNVENDEVAEAPGEITVTLNQKSPIDGYTVSSDMGSASVPVTDDDAGAFPTISITADESIYEGEDAVFELAVSDATAGVSKVRVEVSETGNFLVQSASTARNVDVDITNGVGRLVEATQPDNVEETNGSVTVKVLPDPETVDTYTAIPEVFHTMMIVDNDDAALPSLTISAGTPADESQPATFNIASVAGTGGATSVMGVMIEISQVGNYLASSVSSPMSVDITTVGTDTPVPIAIENDQYDEDDGQIIARILTDTRDSQAWSVGTTDRTSVVVMDNDDEPTLSIENVTLREGSNPDNNRVMVFEVKLEGTDTKSGKEITVDFATSESSPVSATASSDFATAEGDFLTTSGTLTFAPVTSVAGSGDSTQRIEIEIYGDTVEEDDETFEVTLSNAVNASLPDPSTVVGTIEDDDDAPFVSMTLDNATGSIAEGETMVVTISIGDLLPTSPIVLDVNVVQDGDFIAFRVPRVVELTSTVTSRTIRIATIDDTTNEDDGSIAVTISGAGDGSDYNIDPDSTNPDTTPATIIVTDNDLTTVVEDRISVASNVVNSILEFLDGPSQVSGPESAPAIELPKVSVAAVTPVVDEGAPARFNISGSGNLNDNVVVGYTLTPEGDFFDNLGQGSRWVSLSASQPNALVEIATVDDTTAERDGCTHLNIA